MGGAAFFTGLSGLKANAQGLNAVGDNLANSNTVAYKTKNTFFNELQNAQSLELQPGQGLESKLIQVWTQGNIQQSQLATDLAISGQGFFVVSDGTGGQFFTRAGNFHLNSEGFLVSDNGLFVQGYPVQDGEIDQTAAIGPLNFGPGSILEPRPTDMVRLNINLNSDAAVDDAFETSVVVYDSLGDSHLLSVAATKTATGEWDYSLKVPAVDLGGAASDAPVEIMTGTLVFDSFGQLTSPNADIADITITGLANGAEDIVFEWDLFSAAGKGYLTQLSLPSATSQTVQNGNGGGSLSSITVRETGVVEGLFSNGFSSPLGQLVMASFTNNGGLAKSGENVYTNTTISGEPNFGIPQTGGRGSIIGGALENSNVDIAEEFIKLIIFQRAYQANSRMITTADEVTQETIQLKR